MDRRPLAALLVAGLIGAAPSAAGAQSLDALFAGAPSGTLTDAPANLTARAPKGTLSDSPVKATGGSSSSSTSAGSSTAVASSLPFTGSDPRLTLLLGLAALLAGAGLRLRTGDSRDY